MHPATARWGSCVFIDGRDGLGIGETAGSRSIPGRTGGSAGSLRAGCAEWLRPIDGDGRCRCSEVGRSAWRIDSYRLPTSGKCSPMRDISSRVPTVFAPMIETCTISASRCARSTRLCHAGPKAVSAASRGRRDRAHRAGARRDPARRVDPYRAVGTDRRFVAHRSLPREAWSRRAHLAFKVGDCGALIRVLTESGAPMLDEAPRPGAHDCKVAFVHPRYLGGVLAELVEDPPG